MLLTNFNSELYICQYKAIGVHRGWAGVLYYPVKKLGVRGEAGRLGKRNGWFKGWAGINVWKILHVITGA